MSTSTVNQSELGTGAIPPPCVINWTHGPGFSTSNAAAFQDILAHDLDRLYRVAFRLLRNHEDAEDALQEALSKAFRRLPSFQGRSALSTWMTRIVINSALMTLRRRKSHVEFSLDEIMESQPEALALRAADKWPDPEQMCAAAQLMETMEERFLKLPARDQAAFRFAVIDGHSTKESALTFEVPAGTFKSRIHRARRKLARGMHHFAREACATPVMGDLINDPKSQ